MDPIVIGLWKLKQQMNNIIQNTFEFHKNTLNQISEEIKILQKEQNYCEDGGNSDFHKNTPKQISKEIKVLQNV